MVSQKTRKRWAALQDIVFINFNHYSAIKNDDERQLSFAKSENRDALRKIKLRAAGYATLAASLFSAIGGTVGGLIGYAADSPAIGATIGALAGDIALTNLFCAVGEAANSNREYHTYYPRTAQALGKPPEQALL